MRNLTAILFLALAACGGGDDDGGGGGDGDSDADAGVEEEDVTAPEVLSMSPASGATGVRADAVVVIEFSEPMDQLSVQNSLDTSDLGAVDFAWSDGGATLTITPDEELEIAEGTDPADTAALQFAVTLGTGAEDEAGNAIESGEQTIFKTLRSISVTFGRDNAMTGSANPGAIFGDDNDDLYMGDDGGGGTAVGVRTFITIDLSDLPVGTVEIVSASLAAFQAGTNGGSFDELGDVLLDHVTFAVATDDIQSATDLELNGAFNATAHSALGAIMTSDEDVNVDIDVTTQVQDDLEHRAARGDRSQFRARMETDLNLDDNMDAVGLGRAQLELDVTYLVP